MKTLQSVSMRGLVVICATVLAVGSVLAAGKTFYVDAVHGNDAWTGAADWEHRDEIALKPGETEVVVAGGAPSVVRFAAEEATNFLSQALGEAVPLVNAPTAGRVSVILGENEWSRAAGLHVDDLARDAYRVKAADGRVYILGRDDPAFNLHGYLAKRTGYGVILHGHERATLFGVYGCLEKYAGVRFVFPDDELGTLVKRTDAIRVPAGEETVTPDFLLRNPYMAKDGEWPSATWEGKNPKTLLWLRQRYASCIIPCCHGSRAFKYIERFGKTHPEYLARKKDGSVRLDAKGFAPYQYCWTNPGLRETLYQDAKAYLTGLPASSRGLERWGGNCAYGKYVDIMPDDSFSGCFCSDCQKAYRCPEGKDPANHRCAYATDLMWGVAKEIGERLIREGVPGGITMMSYHPYGKVPSFDLPTNVHVMVAKTGPWSMTNRAKCAEDMQGVRDWAKKLGHKVWIWTYPSKHGQMMIRGVPCVGPHAWGRYYADLHDAIIGGFMECECDESMYNFLNYYVFSHVMWDKDTDVDALLDEVHGLMFGAGADDMKRFFGILEDRWTKRVVGAIKETVLGPKTVRPDNRTLWREVYSPACRTELEELLSAAAAKVPVGSKEAKRIALMRREFYDRMCGGAAEFEALVKDVENLRYDATKGPLELNVLDAGRKRGKPKVRTVVAVRETADALIFDFDCEEPEMGKVSTPYVKPGDPNNWRNNCVELRLNPSGDRNRVYYVNVSSSNVGTSSFTDTASGLPTDWTPLAGVRSETRETEVGWKASITVPKSVLKDMRRAFPVEFCRYRVLKGERGEAIQWSPFAHGFGDVERFGTMVLEELPLASK